MNISHTQKNHKIISVIGVFVLVVSVAIILFSGATGMTQDNIEQRLRQLAVNISTEAADSGQEAKLSYGTVTMEGWGYDKHATVDDISLDLAEKSVLDTTRWSLSTTQMKVRPAPTLPGELVLVFANPVNVIENGQLESIMTFSSPLKYGYFDGSEHQEHLIVHNVHLPEQITLSPAKTADQSDNDRTGKIVISYDPNPLWHIKSLPDSGQREINYQFRNVKIAADDGRQMTIASIDSSFNEKPGADKRPQGSYVLTLVDFNYHDNDKATPSYTLNANLTYSGDTPVLKLEHLTPGIGNSDITLNQLLLAADDFKIKASGTLSIATDDPLPAGNLNLDIDNVQPFLASELVPESSRKLVAAALQKITGQPAQSLTNIEIPLKREKNGVLYVGNVTFEELAASMVGDMMKPGAQAPAAATASPEAPGATVPPATAPKVDAPAQPAPQSAEPNGQPTAQSPAVTAPRPDDNADKSKPAKGTM